MRKNSGYVRVDTDLHKKINFLAGYNNLSHSAMIENLLNKIVPVEFKKIIEEIKKNEGIS